MNFSLLAGEGGGVSDGDVVGEEPGSEGEHLRLEEDALDVRPLLDGALEAFLFLGGILPNTWNAQTISQSNTSSIETKL